MRARVCMHTYARVLCGVHVFGSQRSTSGVLRNSSPCVLRQGFSLSGTIQVGKAGRGDLLSCDAFPGLACQGSATTLSFFTWVVEMETVS